MNSATLDYSLVPEIRARLKHVEEPFWGVAGHDPSGNPVGGVDLLAMSTYLSKESFRAYLEASRELKALTQPSPVAGEVKNERLTNANVATA